MENHLFLVTLKMFSPQLRTMQELQNATWDFIGINWQIWRYVTLMGEAASFSYDIIVPSNLHL